MKKPIVLSILFASCFLFSSCREESVVPGTVSMTPASTESTVTETTENMEDEEYTLYLEKFGEPFAKVFYEQRATGSPDLLPNCLLGNESDIRMKPTQEQYSLSVQDLQWGITIMDVSEDLRVNAYLEDLNIEKYDGDTWVRLAVYDTGRYVKTHEATGKSPSSDVIKSRLVSSKLRVFVEHIYPAPTPGMYRFVFYASVEQDGKTENRMYYIPFEVVE